MLVLNLIKRLVFSNLFKLILWRDKFFVNLFANKNKNKNKNKNSYIYCREIILKQI